jgi:hypothetical protein
MKHKITVQQVVDHFAGIKELPSILPGCWRIAVYESYIHAEVGRYKPFDGRTIAALRKRGYRVEKWYRGNSAPDCYYIHPKKEAV